MNALKGRSLTYETVQLVEHIESGNPISVLQEGLVADIVGFVAFEQHGPDCGLDVSDVIVVDVP